DNDSPLQLPTRMTGCNYLLSCATDGHRLIGPLRIQWPSTQRRLIGPLYPMAFDSKKANRPLVSNALRFKEG
ncbi:hypothetical protein AVEN_239480-1, partial [Araneus ventricosus]